MTTTRMRGAYAISTADAVAANMNLIADASPNKTALDGLHAAGLQAIIWLGDCKKQADGTLGFVNSDAAIRTMVGAVKGHPAIYAYQVCDEPNNNFGSNAQANCKARSDLIKSVDPSKPTYVTIGGYGGYGSWAGVTDILGIDPYPSRFGTFKMSDLTDALARLKPDAAKLPHVIAVYQTFTDSNYFPMPSAAQTQQQIDAFVVSGLIEGVVAYRWTKGSQSWITDWAQNHADVVTTVKNAYAKLAGQAPAPSPTPTPAPAPTPSPTPTPVPTPTPAPGPLAVTGLRLYDATIDKPLGAVVQGCVVDHHFVPTALSIVADATGAASVKFDLDSGKYVHIENAAPYTLGGDSAGVIYDAHITDGSHTLIVTPYPQANAQGTPGAPLKVGFTVQH